MNNKDEWEVDIRKSIRKYEASSEGMGYDYSTYYRHCKPIVNLESNGRKYIPHDSKNATLR